MYTLHKLAKRGQTWKNLVADVARLKQEVSDHKRTILIWEARFNHAAVEANARHEQTMARWIDRRAQDEKQVVDLLIQHEQEIESRIHAHHRIRNIVMLAVQTALLGTRQDIHNIYDINKPQ